MAGFDKGRNDVSRVMCRYRSAGVCHLSKRCNHLQALAAYPPTMDEQSLAAGIFGLATRGMCGLRRCRRSRWALTPPFHPYPLVGEGAVIFCHTRLDVAADFPLGSAVLCVARTFLLASFSQATDHTSATYKTPCTYNYYMHCEKK